ncbi:MAG TPA: hypothetical protein PLW97_12130, partial [Synergistaceae bacterium]|nr:hypothetical protein [Synergistaceae bacterium]
LTGKSAENGKELDDEAKAFADLVVKNVWGSSDKGLDEGSRAIRDIDFLLEELKNNEYAIYA